MRFIASPHMETVPQTPNPYFIPQIKYFEMPTMKLGPISLNTDHILLFFKDYFKP